MDAQRRVSNTYDESENVSHIFFGETSSFYTRPREVLLRFALKEALYKAIYPRVQRFVSFAEGEVTPFPGGRADVRLLLRDYVCPPAAVEAQSRGHFARGGEALVVRMVDSVVQSVSGCS